jgi:hypothetical protein
VLGRFAKRHANPGLRAGNRFSLINRGRKPIMLNGIDTSTVPHSHLNGFAQAIERIGLAIMGALCGLFVAALVAKANIEAINSIGVLFSAVLYGSVGFYLGTNIPSLPAGATGRSLSHGRSGPPKAFPIALASGAGTFLAAFAALVSVCMIVFDEAPPVIWNVGIGFWWMVGVLLQLTAGTAARLGQLTGAPSELKASRRSHNRTVDLD